MLQKLEKELKEIQGGQVPKNKYTDIITKFAMGYFEMPVPDFLTPDMKKELQFFNKEMSRDGGVNLTLYQFGKYAHIYNKRADHARYLYSCFISYQKWLKEYQKDILLERILNGKFPKGYTTKEAKRLHVLKEDKKFFATLLMITDTVTSLLYLFEEEGKRTDRELTIINRLMESNLITQKATENRHR